MTSPPPYAHKGDRPPWSWQGVAAVIVAISVGGGWFTGIVVAAIEARDATLDTGLASLLNGIGQVLAGALGTYLGFAAGAAHTTTTTTPAITERGKMSDPTNNGDVHVNVNPDQSAPQGVDDDGNPSDHDTIADDQGDKTRRDRNRLDQDGDDADQDKQN